MIQTLIDISLLYFLLGLMISYLLGSIPSAYILGRLFKGVDIRKFGSGNVGATNAFRVLGKTAAIVVLIFDMLKGFIPVFFIADYPALKPAYLSPDLAGVLLGLAAVCGHSWTIFLNFKGGKGVATTFGVLIALALKIPGFQYVFLVSVAVWLLSLFLSRMVSFASVLSALTFPLFMYLFKLSRELTITCLFFSAFIILRHKSNIQRILQGKEPRIK